MDNVKKNVVLPPNPGIYLFYSATKELIYVGKATSLRDRVRSYFSGKRSPRPVEEMIHEVEDIQYKQTDSVLEAVILESIYIKTYQPKYNVIGKDNKSWNYIVLTRDEYPLVATLREHEYKQMTESEFDERYLAVYGPYPGLNTKAAMKLLRELFRFSTCQKKKRSKKQYNHPSPFRLRVVSSAERRGAGGEVSNQRPCLYYQMGQCLGVCTGEISPAEYREKVIKPLQLFLSGKKKLLVRQLEQKMKMAAKDHSFEAAALYRDQLKSLYRIHDVVLLNRSFFIDNGSDGIARRIEGYDISNLGATGKVGSMVVFTGGEPDKASYRRFKIKTVSGQSDVDCLEEVLRRRFTHDEWQWPEVLLIDGGLPQVNRAKLILEELGITIPVVGIAKGPERKRNDFILGTHTREFVRWVEGHKTVLVRVRDEAHRFAIQYQRKVR